MKDLQMGSDCSDANKFAEHKKAVDKRANVTPNYPADLNRKILRKALNSWDYCKNSRTIQRRKQRQEKIVLASQAIPLSQRNRRSDSTAACPWRPAKVGGLPSAGITITGAVVGQFRCKTLN